MKIEDMIVSVQKHLGVQVDGRAGPETWNAIYKVIVPGAKTGAYEIDRVDERSERSIATLEPPVQRLARALVHKAKSNNIAIKVISGLRSFPEQDRIYAMGRTAQGDIVTNAKAGYSNHNFGIAFDIGVFEGNHYLADSPKYIAVGILGLELGLEWGGSWKSIVDRPHFQLRPSWARDLTEPAMLAELRTRHADGRKTF